MSNPDVSRIKKALQTTIDNLTAARNLAVYVTSISPQASSVITQINQKINMVIGELYRAMEELGKL